MKSIEKIFLKAMEEANYDSVTDEDLLNLARHCGIVSATKEDKETLVKKILPFFAKKKTPKKTPKKGAVASSILKEDVARHEQILAVERMRQNGLDSLTNAELKLVCKEWGLTVGGNKEALRNRISTSAKF